MSQRDCGEIGPGREVLQFFRIEEPPTSMVLEIATYHRDLSRTVKVDIYRVLSQTDDRRLTPEFFRASIVRDAPLVSVAKHLWRDNEKLTIHTDPESMGKGDRFAIHITSPGPADKPAATAWLHATHHRIPGHIQTFYGAEGQGEFGLMAEFCRDLPTSQWRVPPAVLYSPVTQCNLNCIHCISRESRESKARLCPSIKAQLKAWCDAGEVVDIRTDYSGDILWADWKFGGELDFLIDLGVPFHIDTNGVHLSEAASAKLMQSRLGSLNVSLDAATTETFQRVRKGAPPLEGVLQNLERFAEMRRDAGAVDSIKLSASFTLMRSTLHEWEDFLRLTAACGVDTVYARHLEAFTEDMGPDSLIFDKTRFRKVAERARRVAEDVGVELATADLARTFGRGGHGRCEVAWGSALIMGNGDVAACCVPRTTMGNLNETPMEELWNGPVYREFRRRVNSSDPPPQCASCPMMRDHENVHSFLPFLTMETWRHPRDWDLGSPKE